MYIINKKKNAKGVVDPDVLRHRASNEFNPWPQLESEDKKLNGIKSITIQLRDISQMRYSYKKEFLILYAKYAGVFKNIADVNLNQLITIRVNSETKKLVYAILISDWLINKEKIEKKNSEEIEAELTKVLNLSIIYDEAARHESSEKFRRILESKSKEQKYKYICLQEHLLERDRNIALESNPTLKLTSPK